MTALVTTGVENVAPVRVDLRGDSAIYIGCDWYQRFDLEIPDGAGGYTAWDLSGSPSPVSSWVFQLKAAPTSETTLQTGAYVAADSSLSAGEIMVHVDATALSEALAGRSLFYSLSLETTSTDVIPIVYGQVELRGHRVS
jgi:hypothetical protein